MIGTGMAFLVQLFADRLTAGGFTAVFGLSLPGLRALNFWQPLTYMFLHGGFWHLVLNMLCLFFFGPETERAIGTRRFVALYFACGILGGLGWILIGGSSVLPCVGASGAIFGVLGAYAGLFPQRPVTLLVLFVIPVTMRARTLAIGLGLFNLLASVSQQGQIAYAAHLAGGLAGYLYGLYGANQGFGLASFNPFRWWTDFRWNRQRRKFKILQGSDEDWQTDKGTPPSQQEVDEVLAKISKWGMGRLTQHDRDILDRASRRR